MTCEDCGKALSDEEYVAGWCQRCFANIPAERPSEATA